MGLKVSNPDTERELRAQVFGDWYEIEPGGSISVSDPKVAACLCEYGASMSAEELAKAREAWQAGNVAQNADYDSSPARSDAGLRARGSADGGQQVTADPSGTQPGPNPGAAYDPADHTVGEVEVYLANASEEERARVIAVESGRVNSKGDSVARKGITEWQPPQV